MVHLAVSRLLTVVVTRNEQGGIATDLTGSLLAPPTTAMWHPLRLPSPPPEQTAIVLVVPAPPISPLRPPIRHDRDSRAWEYLTQFRRGDKHSR